MLTFLKCFFKDYALNKQHDSKEDDFEILR